ncbi:hypothetical protein EI94DRAFT_1705672 [Lactarius quietus]|nr:hypothetical protein EI94DRAFT_1705672 [Lactarius quietus]
MWLPLPNATYRIKNTYYNNTYLTLDNAIDGTALVLAQLKTGNDAKKQKWVLRNQGYTGGPDCCQIVTLQYEGDRGPKRFGVFYRRYSDRPEAVKSSELSHVQDSLHRRGRDLLLYGGGGKVILDDRKKAHNRLDGQQPHNIGQQWFFEKIDFDLVQ